MTLRKTISANNPPCAVSERDVGANVGVNVGEKLSGVKMPSNSVISHFHIPIIPQSHNLQGTNR